MPDTETPNDSRETLSDREFKELKDLAFQMGEATGHALAARFAAYETSIGELLARLDMHQKQLDHIDCMLHEVHQFIEEHKPALGRALAFLDPGKSMRDYLRSRPKAAKSNERT